jgi:predicted metal-dependent HD superfamily phosphohydrolase
MAILIDPARWPAHGTVFSHLVSDESLEELHAFARATGVSPNAFDGDHYDVPVSMYEDLVAAGAQEVSGSELVRRLMKSGLRITAAERSSKIEKILHQRFERLFPHTSVLDRDPIFESLIERWSEQHRHYHDLTHLMSVLKTIEYLERQGEPMGPFPRAVKVAGWFHDAIYRADPVLPPGQDEEDSARLAERVLPELGVPGPEILETVRLIRLTFTHDPHDDDYGGKVLCDADLEVLGRHSGAYQRYREGIRKDFVKVGDDRFNVGREKFLRGMLARNPIFNTPTGQKRWERAARRNLMAELYPRGRKRDA